jgi:hypothetical protein
MMISEAGDAACVAKAGATVVGANLTHAVERRRDWRLEVPRYRTRFRGDGRCAMHPWTQRKVHCSSVMIFEDLIRGGKKEALSTSTCRLA